jgi:hypothetical protein
MSPEERRGQDRRKDRRYRCSGQVRVWQTGSGLMTPGWIVNLSMGGCLLQLRTPVPFKMGATVEASFQSSYLAFRSFGCVRRVDPEHSLLGLCYVDLSLRGRLDLAELFGDLEALMAEGYWNRAHGRIEDRRRESILEPRETTRLSLLH